MALGLRPLQAATGTTAKHAPSSPRRCSGGWLCRSAAASSGKHLTPGVAAAAACCWPTAPELSLPDTAANQQAYPQPKSQKPGLGFPALGLVVLLTFATACLVGAPWTRAGQGNGPRLPCLRALLPQVEAGDVVVADRYFCSWWLVALLLERGADVAFRLHQRRHCDFRCGRRLGQGDHVVGWDKPPRPAWIGPGNLAALAALADAAGGARPGEPARLSGAATDRGHDAAGRGGLSPTGHRGTVSSPLACGIRCRKSQTNAAHGRAQLREPGDGAKAIWAHFLGYNLIRKVLAEAALARKRTPRQLSFAGALQTWQGFRWLLVLAEGEARRPLAQALRIAVGTHAVGNRPHRVEPREVKRRKKGRLLTKPRQQRRAELLAETGAAQE